VPARYSRFYIKKSNLKKLNEVEGKQQFRVEVSNSFTASEDLVAEVEINRAREIIKQNIKISAKESLGYTELKKHKPWFDEGCLKLVDKWKQAKLQQLQDPSEINEDNLNNIRRKVSRYFRNKKREYLKDKIKELATNSKNKIIRDLCRCINEFKGDYLPKNYLVKDENDDLHADSQNILNMWKNFFSQLLNMHNVSDVRQIEKHTTEPLVPGPSRLKSPGSEQIPAELIQAGGKMLLSAIHELITSIWYKEELPDQWKEPILVEYHCCEIHTKCYRISFSQL
jgi:hypothetical protein